MRWMGTAAGGGLIGRWGATFLASLAGAALSATLIVDSHWLLGALGAALTAHHGWVVRKLIGASSAAEQQQRQVLVCQAEMTALKARLDPHFLYNTLATVQALIRRNGEAADALLSHLVKYMRYALSASARDMSDLGTEFDVADAYLQIARVRMGKRLSASVHLDEGLDGIAFPRLALQVMVENAITHGAENKVGPVSVKVRATLVGNVLTVSVSDDGAGLEQQVQPPGHGTGLSNLRRRLAAIYGDGAKLVVVGREDGGVTATLKVHVCTVQGSERAVAC